MTRSTRYGRYLLNKQNSWILKFNNNNNNRRDFSQVVRDYLTTGFRMFLSSHDERDGEKTWRAEGRSCTSHELPLTRTNFNVIDILNMDLAISYPHRRKTTDAPNSEPWERSAHGGPRWNTKRTHRTLIIRVSTKQLCMYVFVSLSSLMLDSSSLDGSM